MPRPGPRIFGTVIALLACACARQPALKELIISGETQGTTFAVRIVDVDLPDERVARIQQLVADRLESIENLMSTYRKDSEISRFNQTSSTQPVNVSPEMIDVMLAAQNVSMASGGAFDVTVAPIVSAWGFGPDGVTHAPSQDELDRLRAGVGYQKVEVDPAAKTLRKAVPEVTIDLNGIAQGYTVDKLAADLDSAGVPNYMVEIGGEVKARGHNLRGVPWQIGVERPVAGAREIEIVVPLKNTAISTSGDYRRYREQDGVRISHTIDPRTAKPIEHKLAAVSIINDSCTLADGFCTAIMVLGPEEGFELAMREGLAALLVVHAGDGRFIERRTPAFNAVMDK